MAGKYRLSCGVVMLWALAWHSIAGEKQVSPYIGKGIVQKADSHYSVVAIQDMASIAI